MMSNISLAFLLTTIAGLSTLVGTIPIFFKIKNENSIICASLAFASSVMFTISIIDLIPESFNLLNNYIDFLKIIIIFISIIIIIITSYLIDNKLSKESNNNLYKVGIITMIAIVIHNIPEGIITFISTTKNIKLGLSLTIAIALHNIPEGISISIPIYYSTKSRLKAFIYTFISGLSELLGAILTYVFLFKYINSTILGILLSLTAGIMISISMNELLIGSLEYNNIKLTRKSFIMGIIIVIINLVF